MPEEAFYKYLPDGVSFTSEAASGINTVYMALCGIDALSIKSSVTPALSGDIKLDKFHYLTKPASREDLRQPLREFFVFIANKGVFGLSSECAPGLSHVEAGQLWHKVIRTHPKAGLQMTALNFVPVSGEPVELMQVSIKNISKTILRFTPTAAIPLFGRSLANKHDHEHVTALLNRVMQTSEGVVLQPTMAFNEEGHRPAGGVYFVFGRDGRGGAIAGSFPTVDSFYGDSGCLQSPRAVTQNHQPVVIDDLACQGKEAVGALRFKETVLKPGQSVSYVVAIGMAETAAQAKKIFGRFSTSAKFEKALKDNQIFWSKKVSSISLQSGDPTFNAWMRWVTLQPVLRRIFGCSFLPDHDYGKGGKGWRDIWQDLLSLILIEPQSVREDLINNCAGIRIDGSNATIIGNKRGEFLADRNAITRVWMDHGAWPFLTLQLYINQSGDFDILLEKQSYFRDPQLSRTYEKDMAWSSRHGNKLLDGKGRVYEGTILEHLLVQNLTQFFNVGRHNIIRLESADWNDGLDMAFAQGESVAFTSFYGSNLLKLADTIEHLGREKKLTKIRLAKEVLILLDTLQAKINYDDPQAKRQHLLETYCGCVQPALSGETVDVGIVDIAADLRAKGQWIFNHVRRQEKIRATQAGKTYEWFNGYYDNKAQRVEGLKDKRVRMTLTGQVFSIMSGMASEEDIVKVVASVNHFLKDPHLGGYRLNTDFGVPHYLDLGRAFGFAYGTKENGAFFSHMTVMYAFALYERGFSRQGHEVLQSIYRMANHQRSKIYPGIPEYFDGEGRGMYHYLTGSASWLVLTELTQVFGVRGLAGELVLAPQLVKEQFDAKQTASVTCPFDGKVITVEYHNPHKRDAGHYRVAQITCGGRPMAFKPEGTGIVISRRQIQSLNASPILKILLS